jgi:HAAS
VEAVLKDDLVAARQRWGERDMSHESADLDTFVSALREYLPGPSKLRAEILAEVRDGLIESVDDHVGAGLEEQDARDRALREFGDPIALARSFLPELAAERARRTAQAVLLTAPLVIGLWLAAARSRPVARTGGLFDGAVAHATAAALIAAVLLAGLSTIAITGRATRWFSIDARAQLLGAVATTSVAAATDIALLLLLSWRLVGFPGAFHQLALGAALLASTARLIIATRSSRVCLGEARRT